MCMYIVCTNTVRPILIHIAFWVVGIMRAEQLLVYLKACIQHKCSTKLCIYPNPNTTAAAQRQHLEAVK